MSKKSIFDVIGREKAFRLMERAVVAAAKKNKEAGVATASHINGRTVLSTPETTSVDAISELRRAKSRVTRAQRRRT